MTQTRPEALPGETEREYAIRNCETCGKPFSSPNRDFRRGFGRFCSLKCRPKRTRPISERLWAKVDKSGECWVWTGARDRSGYGKISIGGHDGGHTRAHRVAWELTYGNHPCLRGPMLSGIFVLHHCDNPPCCRPDHLFLGDAGANARDMAAKGRQVYQAHPEKRPTGARAGVHTHPEAFPRGETHPHAKLTTADVRSIRGLIASGNHRDAVARQFGVTKSAIQHIVKGRVWKETAND